MKSTIIILLSVEIIGIIYCTKLEFGLNRNISRQHHRHLTSVKQRRRDTQPNYTYRRSQAVVSQLWLQYINCNDQLVDGRVPSDAVMVYEGAVARLPCRLCVSPDEADRLVWMYAQSRSSLTFTELDKTERYVRDEADTTLTIYHATPEDAGVYRCELDTARGGYTVLEVVDDEENYDVVKPRTTRGPYEAGPTELLVNLSLFTSWSKWSECSRCGHVGRRRRYGICTVALKNIDTSPAAGDDTMNIFREFPKGIPCRSKYLPDNIKDEVKVQKRASEIMIGMCKVPCKNALYEVRSRSGRLLERVNNSGGVFSLAQRLPPQPPPPVHRLVFVELTGALVIRCPGTSLRDIPVRWSVNNKPLLSASADLTSAGRLYLNARDHLVITTLLYADDNTYRCHEGAHTTGSVQVCVWRRVSVCKPRLILTTLVIFTYVCVCCYFAH